MTEMQANPSFRLAYVPGVTPGKWVRVWEQRLPDVPLTLVAVPVEEGEPTLLGGGADAGLVRLPVDRDNLSAIPLYTETTVVVFPKDHWLAAAEEVPVADLADEIVFHPLDDALGWQTLPGRPAIERPATTGDAIELVAANVGVLLVPQSLARLHHRRDLTYRPVPDAPQSQVALSWLQDRTTDLVEEFIGIVRGRTVNSSRGRTQAAEPERPKQQQTGGKPSAKPGGKTAGAKTAGGKTVGGKSAAGRGGGTGKPGTGRAAGGRSGGAKPGAGKSGGARRGRPGR
ncbi:LysR family substrate-binding domain-containing protein [Kitasatospora sp. NPDC047058]|uniref:LysR family substrate-binding domain-containing protein n=1 Tax=Kitasatospora sp. NPDC047058 TaxID=3155620 RepID=UPI0033F3DD6E